MVEPYLMGGFAYFLIDFVKGVHNFVQVPSYRVGAAVSIDQGCMKPFLIKDIENLKKRQPIGLVSLFFKKTGIAWAKAELKELIEYFETGEGKELSWAKQDVEEIRSYLEGEQHG